MIAFDLLSRNSTGFNICNMLARVNHFYLHIVLIKNYFKLERCVHLTFFGKKNLLNIFQINYLKLYFGLLHFSFTAAKNILLRITLYVSPRTASPISFRIPLYSTDFFAYKLPYIIYYHIMKE